MDHFGNFNFSPIFDPLEPLLEPIMAPFVPAFKGFCLYLQALNGPKRGPRGPKMGFIGQKMCFRPIWDHFGHKIFSKFSAKLAWPVVRGFGRGGLILAKIFTVWYHHVLESEIEARILNQRGQIAYL